MERLTTRIDGYAYGKSGIKRLSKDYHRGSFECTALIERLAEYEELEEQGLLLRLPCKVGDDFYWISDEEPEHGIKSEVKICGKIKGIAVMEDGFYIIGEDGDMNKVGSQYALLTRKDAEWKLKELQKDGADNE